MKTNCARTMLLVCGLAALAAPGRAQDAVEPAGTLPVLRNTDVVVVGGTCGGVAAAIEAAKKGARVFLAAPRPYLGEDVAGTYRLWLEPGEKPTTDLARAVFAPPAAAPGGVSPGLPFTYSTTPASGGKHADTRPPARLADGKWDDSPKNSVQYGGDTTILLDLGAEQQLTRVHLMPYQRNADFAMAQASVAASSDRKAWKPLGTITNDRLGDGTFEDDALDLSIPVQASARYLKLEVKMGADAKRLLLGEVLVEGEAKPAAAPAAAAAVQPVTPMQVKRALDEALIKAGVTFLYGTYATDVLRDAQGKPAGIVVVNRSGRQAVTAKVIIDATERSSVARMAGAEFTPWPAGTATFRRTLVGGEVRTDEHLKLLPRTPPLSIQARKGDAYPVREYQLEVPMSDGRFSSFAEVEQLARDWTWTTNTVDASETLFQVPPDTFRSAHAASGAWPGADRLPLACLQPAGLERVFALGGCADLSREAAAELLRPVNLMAVGERLGAAAAEQAAKTPALEGVRRAAAPARAPVKGEIRYADSLAGHRATALTVPSEAGRLPVLGEYDVVVVGGGTGGAPAAIGAGRQGAKTLLIEYLHGLGGVGTLGYIATYYHGNRCGYTSELDQEVNALGGAPGKPNASTWNPEHKSEVYRRDLRKAHVTVWYGAMGAGALVEGGRVTGVVVLTAQGPGVVLAKTVIDGTGNADIAAAAGAACRYTDDTDVAVQGAGLPPKQLGQKYTNTDYSFVDDTDAFDLWRMLVVARQKFKTAYDLGQLVDTRERRQIVGDATLSPMDLLLARTQPDTVVIARSNFDTHGYIVSPMFMLRPPTRDSRDVHVPFRCLLPRGLEGILVIGLGVSAHRDALPCIRMEPDIQNQGYAAGIAAAMVAKKGGGMRDLDIKALQRQLVKIGNLPASVLTETDSFPLPEAQVAAAVRAVAKDYDQLEVVLARFDVARPLLREALAKAEAGPAQLVYAHVLGMMGDAAGADTLARSIAAAPGWDKGWRYVGMGQFGPCMSPLDSRIIALGRTKSPAAVKPILEKVGQLTPESEFSHFRAVALALEALADPSAAAPLAALLRQPGLGGHAVTNIEANLKSNPANPTDTTMRNQELSELYLARALFRCGDADGLGRRTLEQYARDLHGHYARHAQAVLGRAAAAKP